MKSLILSLFLVFSLTIPALAKDLSFIACTKDHKAATLSADISEDASTNTVAHISQVFTATANSLSADDLTSSVGFNTFRAQLTQDDTDALNRIYGPPTIGGSCAQ